MDGWMDGWTRFVQRELCKPNNGCIIDRVGRLIQHETREGGLEWLVSDTETGRYWALTDGPTTLQNVMRTEFNQWESL